RASPLAPEATPEADATDGATDLLDTGAKVRHKRSRVKAVVFHEFGGVEVLRVEELREPEPGPGEVVIEIGATALNHLDVDVREGTSRFPIELPHVLGVEIVGRISAVGEGVEDWAVGDRVMPYLMDTCGACRYCRT